MIEKDKFNILNYVKKEEYTGSMDGMRYMVKKIDSENMELTIWPEPNACAKTSEDLKTRKTFPLSAIGVEMVADYLNEEYTLQKKLWDISKFR